jgi:hypothetical protein
MFLLWRFRLVVCKHQVQASILAIKKAWCNLPPWMRPWKGKRTLPLLFLLWHFYSKWFAWVWMKTILFLFSFNLYFMLSTINVSYLMSFLFYYNLQIMFFCFGFQEWKVNGFCCLLHIILSYFLSVISSRKFFWSFSTTY